MAPANFLSMPARLLVVCCAFMLASAAVCLAQTPTPAPKTSTATTNPVAIEHCDVPHGGWLFKGGRAMPISIWFRNTTSKSIDSVRIDVLEAGVPKGGTTFAGTFSPQTLIQKVFLDYQAANIDVHAVSCSVSRVEFADGSVWRGNTANSVIVRQPGAPVEIKDCAAFPMSANAPSYNEALTLSFTDISQQPLTAVKFGFDLYDSFDTKLTSIGATVHGEFSPGALIEPRTNGSEYVYSPSSPAWRYYFGPGSSDNVFRAFAPNDVATAKCYVIEARFVDGTVWKSGTSSAAGDGNSRL